MEVNFKFKIGEIVTTKLDIAEYELGLKTLPVEDLELLRRTGRIMRPVMMFVVSRWMEECPGGVQIHYGIIHRSDQAGIMSTKVNEQLLVPYPEALNPSA